MLVLQINKGNLMTHLILFLVAVVLIVTGGAQGLTSNQTVDKWLSQSVGVMEVIFYIVAALCALTVLVGVLGGGKSGGCSTFVGAIILIGIHYIIWQLLGGLSDNWSANSGAQGPFYLYVFIYFFLGIL